jgi:hypothetical protein
MAQVSPAKALEALPLALRDELLAAVNSVVKNYREGRWEPAELNGGKLCEVVYSILAGMVAGKFPDRAKKPKNMLDACKALEQADQSFPRSVRVQIPRILIALYEVRNNRGVGHVGGDVDPNHMDARLVLELSKWLLAELVRLFHGVNTQEAQQTVDGLIERTVPTIWSVANKKRVLSIDLSYKQKVLLLLYAESPVEARTLLSWVEHPNYSDFRRGVLVPLHRERLIELDADSNNVFLSPLGVDLVERDMKGLLG